MICLPPGEGESCRPNGTHKGWRRFISLRCPATALMLPMVLAFLAYGALHALEAFSADRSVASCVVEDVAKGGDGTNCIGRHARTCLNQPDTHTVEEQVECIQTEFVLWQRFLREQKKAIKAYLTTEKERTAFREAEGWWQTAHMANCKLPYTILPEDAARTAGPWCSLRLTAQRALILYRWRQSLTASWRQ